jgi:hypothetical protein
VFVGQIICPQVAAVTAFLDDIIYGLEKPMGDSDNSLLGSTAGTKSLKLIFVIGTRFPDILTATS